MSWSGVSPYHLHPVSGLLPLIADQSPFSYDGWLLFFKGTWVGLAVTAPPGPVGGLAVKRTVRFGFWQGMSVALGALLADVALGAIAMVPSSQFHGLGAPWDTVIAFAVAAALLALGVKFFRRALRGEVFDKSAPETGPVAAAVSGGTGLAGAIGRTFGTFLLTLMTPATIPFFIGVFTQLKLGQSSAETTGGPFLVIAGVAAGAAVWWVALCGVAHRYRQHAAKWMQGLEFVCAGLMFVGAGVAIWKGFAS